MSEEKEAIVNLDVKGEPGNPFVDVVTGYVVEEEGGNLARYDFLEDALAGIDANSVRVHVIIGSRHHGQINLCVLCGHVRMNARFSRDNAGRCNACGGR